MSIFNITDYTPAAALCNAIDAARKSDRRAAQRRRKSIAEFGALDDRTLRDIGVSRGAIRHTVQPLSLEAERQISDSARRAL